VFDLDENEDWPKPLRFLTLISELCVGLFTAFGAFKALRALTNRNTLTTTAHQQPEMRQTTMDLAEPLVRTYYRCAHCFEINSIDPATGEHEVCKCLRPKDSTARFTDEQCAEILSIDLETLGPC
jgi:hypothetical protein